MKWIKVMRDEGKKKVLSHYKSNEDHLIWPDRAGDSNLDAEYTLEFPEDKKGKRRTVRRIRTLRLAKLLAERPSMIVEV